MEREVNDLIRLFSFWVGGPQEPEQAEILEWPDIELLNQENFNPIGYNGYEDETVFDLDDDEGWDWYYEI